MSWPSDELVQRALATVRALTPWERDRWLSMFDLLYAEREPHEPDNEEQRTQTRVERLKEIYPDVFEAIASTTEHYAEQARKENNR